MTSIFRLASNYGNAFFLVVFWVNPNVVQAVTPFTHVRVAHSHTSQIFRERNSPVAIRSRGAIGSLYFPRRLFQPPLRYAIKICGNVSSLFLPSEFSFFTAFLRLTASVRLTTRFSFQRPALFRYLNLIKLFESLSSLFFTVGAFRFFRRLLAAFQGLRGALFSADFF